MTRFIRILVLGVVCAVLRPSGAAAQAQVTGFAPEESPTTAPGWTFTPSMTYSAGYDDNVLMRGVGDNVQGDFVSLVGPAADLAYNSSRSQLQAHYSGGIELYRDYGNLDAYDQQASLLARHLVTKHLAVFARESFSITPTTQLLQFVGIPFVRTGSDVEDLRAGIENAFTKRFSINASYHFQWVKFDPTAFGVVLLGGSSQGGSVISKYQITERTAITASGDAEFATINAPASYLAPQFDVHYAVANGTLQDFQTQTVTAGIERRITETLRAFAAAGFSHLAVSNFGPGQTGPAWNLGLTNTYRQTTYNVTYSRSFVPAFGFGGTMQNEQLSGNVQRPLARRISIEGTVAWMRNQPLVTGQLNLFTFWVGGNVAYAVNRWMRVEGYYGGVHQTIDQPGGVLDRNQFGIQVVTAKPMRIP